MSLYTIGTYPRLYIESLLIKKMDVKGKASIIRLYNINLLILDFHKKKFNQSMP